MTLLPRLAVPSIAAAAATLLASAAASADGTSPAADLRADADRVARLWSAEGAIVRRLPPSFLEQGRARVVDVAASAPPGDGGCVTLAAVAPRTVDLSVATGPAPLGAAALLLAASSDLDEGPEPHGGSGSVVVSRCGPAAGEMALAVLVQRSPRSAVEVLVARSAAPLAPLEALLPERVAGPAAPRGSPGRTLGLGPIDQRLARVETRARGEGAADVSRTRVRPPSSGRGEVGLVLSPGCHRVEVLAEAATRGHVRLPADVDAELRLPPGQVVARDRGDASDARLDVCVGEETPAQLAFVGAPGAAGLHVTDAVWPLPDVIPERWGPRVRAAVFSALRRRNVPLPRGEPVHESFGVQGVTTVPLPVDPGRCYLAVVGVAQGAGRGMRLTAQLGARPAVDEAGPRPEGVAITFCPETGDVVPVVVELQSAGAWWLLGVWELGGETPGAGEGT